MFNIRIHYASAAARGSKWIKTTHYLGVRGAGQMETDSLEKVDTQHGSCCSHLLAPHAEALSSSLMGAPHIISWLFSVSLLCSAHATVCNSTTQNKGCGQVMEYQDILLGRHNIDRPNGSAALLSLLSDQIKSNFIHHMLRKLTEKCLRALPNNAVINTQWVTITWLYTLGTRSESMCRGTR